MSELLLELFSEEIPALMQKNAAEAYKNIFISLLQENEISAEVQVYIGPRRLTVYIPNLPNIIPLKTVEIRGPKVSAPESAVAGFCRSNNIDKKNLSTLLVQDQLYYILKKQTQPIDIRILLSEIIVKAISKYTWLKSMKWGNYDIDWVRPLRNILCIFDGKVLPIKYGHLIANNLTFGHRFIQPSAIEVNNFADYECKLVQAKVILNQAERKESIVMQLDSIASALNLIIKKDEKLLEEVTGLVELPVVMVGKIPEKFLKLPSEVLISSMKTHQKYFSTFDKEGNFAPYFLFVSNMLSDEYTIVRGNEKVLSARLSDALYFYQQDLVYSLETRLPKLAQITFHAQLGTIRQKIDRIVSICQFISPKNQNLQIAARLCKSDLTSEMVGEFPELQGIMGHYYAKAEGLNEDIAIAIRDHYKPQGSKDNLPLTDAAIIAIADKLDSLVGLILIGEEPSGSRDPYSLRRQAGGIIRIILGNELKINIKQLVAHTISLYQFLSREDFENTKSQLILSFLAERAKYYFKDHYNMPLINAIIDFNIEEDLVISKRKIEALQKLLEGENGNNLLTIYKRANNILEGIDREGEINQDAFISNYEQQLFISLKYITKQVDYYIAERDFSAAFGILLEILKPINEFFDNLLVKDSDPIISNNRLLLLQIVKQLFNKLANFDIL
ncbi:glycine--tRNA ligase subunit beta [Candidatus Tisiphia endosymbiont of Nemotelus uliginosus]|uniref:glycine--tRNA ligase subunit beta n=1 Tax=Candidatus Tisiphia endosymbiont of Nemotelus uliginosus TaxID=3077926 RepID=UPI0035C8F509